MKSSGPGETASGPFVVEAAALTRHFGRRAAVDAVDLTLAPGDCLALFGPNGAGKTTLLRMLGGLLKPSSGTASIAGRPLPGGAAVRAMVGIISHQTLLYEALTARENVEFAASLYHLPDARASAEAALARMGMLEHADTTVRLLSRGMRQRVSIARATVHQPSILLADEPFTGLDAAGAAALTRLLGDLLAEGATIVLVTHNLAEGLSLATYAAVMREGRFIRFDEGARIDPATYATEYRELFAHD